MQSSNGGWAAFDVDNDAYWLYDVPFCDFGAVIDPPSVDVTAHALELLTRHPGYEDAVTRGVAYLLNEQLEDGSWFGRWGVNYVYGTGAAAPGSRGSRARPEHPALARAVAWLEAHQNADGGFGEDCRAYDVGEEGESWRGRERPLPRRQHGRSRACRRRRGGEQRGGGSRRLALRAPAGGR